MFTSIPTSENSPDSLLRCVHSGYLDGGCSCQATVPSGIVANAWGRELQRKPAREDQFFNFVWRGGQWLGYGLRDGRVRGVYCPEHCARRAAHSGLASAGVAS
ncbi:MAG TPA: hypothetical protein VMF09_04840 [Solirubrobacteraceae bacterium]|nr:hypothetical protein [Solirubrobacteraceae bacterium]